MNKRTFLISAFAIALIAPVLPRRPLAPHPGSTATTWPGGCFGAFAIKSRRPTTTKCFLTARSTTRCPRINFLARPPRAIPVEVEYKDGDAIKRVALDELLESTGTHAFIVIKDGKLLDERYLNGYQRDSICISRSVAKSFTSALVGIAINEGFIRASTIRLSSTSRNSRTGASTRSRSEIC